MSAVDPASYPAKPTKTTMSFDAYDLQILRLALRGYLDGLENVDWDDDHVHMEKLKERVRLAQQRLTGRMQAEGQAP